jgi:hypothetical protein
MASFPGRGEPKRLSPSGRETERLAGVGFVEDFDRGDLA